MNKAGALLESGTDNGLSRWEQALVIASRLHATQQRKGTAIAYVSHLIAVASLVLEHGGTEDEAIGALLHDAIEDQATNWGGAEHLREMIRSRFGESILEIVNGCTDADVFPKPPWRERKEAYIAHVPTASPPVVLVSCADKLHNARAIVADYREHGEALWGRFNAGREDICWYYRALVVAFAKARVPAGLRREFALTVDELERLVSGTTNQS